MQTLNLRRKREILTSVIFCLVLTVIFLAFIDIEIAVEGRFYPATSIGWVYLALIHLILLGMVFLVLIFILPDLLAVYTEEGVKWPTLTGYKLMCWSEIVFAEDGRDFWHGRRLLLKSLSREISISAQFFIDPDESMNEIKKRIPKKLLGDC